MTKYIMIGLKILQKKTKMNIKFLRMIEKDLLLITYLKTI